MLEIGDTYFLSVKHCTVHADVILFLWPNTWKVLLVNEPKFMSIQIPAKVFTNSVIAHPIPLLLLFQENIDWKSSIGSNQNLFQKLRMALHSLLYSPHHLVIPTSLLGASWKVWHIQLNGNIFFPSNSSNYYYFILFPTSNLMWHLFNKFNYFIIQIIIIYN